MSNKESKYSSFEESIRSSIEGYEQSPSEELWGKISTTLEATKITSPLIVPLRWAGAVAASIMIAIAANSLLEMRSSHTLERFDTVIAEFQSLPSTPILIEPVKIEPAAPSIATLQAAPCSSEERSSSTAPSTVEKIKATRESNSGEEGQKNQRAANQEHSYNIEQYAYTADIQEPKRINIDRPLHLAVMVGGGSPTSTNFIKGMNPMMVSDMPNRKNSLMEMQSNSAPHQRSDPAKYIKHHAPISGALSLAYQLNQRWSIESGLSYTRLNSEVTTISEQLLMQKVDMIGVPFRLNYHILSTPHISIYSGVGGQVERCISAKLNNIGVDENPWHISSGATIGLQYNINQWLGIYTEPEATYYFSKTKLKTLRTDKPISFNLNFGLRFTFGE